MVLPGAPLLPNSLLPLYIFEPRYRQMLDYCLAHQRMFCIAMLKPGHTEANSSKDFFHVGGLGLVRACVGREDGTSHLILQGLARVKFARFIQEEPFRIARLRTLHSSTGSEAENSALCLQVLGVYKQLKDKGVELPPALDEKLPSLSSAELITDVLTQALVQSPFERQLFLEELLVAERLRMLLRYLQKSF